MKLLKKLYYRILFIQFFLTKTRKQNQDIDNRAGLTILHPIPSIKQVKIPKIIWMYWEGQQVPLLIACVRRIQDMHPDYDVHFLDPDTIQQYTQLDLSNHVIKNATPQQRADLIRFDLIYHHGGIWLDASTIIYEKLDWIEDLINETQTQSFSYYRSKNTTNLNYPVMENWLIASTPHNEFYSAWVKELLNALKIGPKYYIQQLQKQNNAKEYFQEIGRLEYLIAYVVCQKVMRECPFSMVFIDCDKNAFFYQVSNKWIKEKILIDIGINLAPKQKPKLIKLAGKERKFLEKYYAESKYLPNSLLDI